MALDTGSQELLDAQAHIYNHMFTFINPMSLRCAIELGIPDAIHKHGQPMTLSQLAEVLHINKAKANGLYHLMRILIHSKFFDKVQTSEDKEAYALPRATRLLLIDGPMNTAPLALLESDPILLRSWLQVSEWFRNEEASSFVTKHGRTIWEHAGVDQRFNKLFNESMASDSRVMDCIFVKECKQVFQGLTSMEDVGGGIGETAKGITHTFPELRCIVLDLPHVVAGLEGSENISFVSGDMLFDPIPHADAVFFKAQIILSVNT